MIGTQRPWMLVLPLSAFGILTGHWVAYRVTGTPAGAYHEYLAHLPRVALVLLVLALVAAHFVERGRRLALWPFPAVALAGFVALEHAERVEQMGSLPFLLTSPVFLVGLAVQLLVAVLAWLVARLLAVAIQVSEAPGRRIARWPVVVAPEGGLLVPAAAVSGVRSRAPPRAC